MILVLCQNILYSTRFILYWIWKAPPPPSPTAVQIGVKCAMLEKFISYTYLPNTSNKVSVLIYILVVDR